MPNHPFVAVDIGNARIKLGLFRRCAAGLPEPLQTLPLLGKEPELDQIEPWLADIPRHGGADIPVCHGNPDRLADKNVCPTRQDSH